MTGRSHMGSRLVMLSVALGILVVPLLGLGVPRASAATDAATLVGEGGSAFQPVMTSLLIADTPGLAPLNPAYTNVKLDDSISDFVGSGPGVFDADYAVTERTLNTTESGIAKANGRTFAYVPFAATPIAIATLVPTSSWDPGTNTITPSNFCQSMPLTLTDLADLFGLDSTDPVTNWADSRLQCTPTGGTADGIPPAKWANLDPTMENEDLMALLDSTPTSKTLFDAGLQQAVSTSQGLTSDDTPSEHWPYAKGTVPGGDQQVLSKLLNVNSTTNAPDTDAGNWQLGAIVPISSVWTGSPLGVAWDIATAAIQNAQGSFVPPTTASASAAEADATLASTSDPTTNNVVTFTASTTDAAAYNNYLMMPEYLVVPTNTLAADKATKLAQFIRYVLGPSGQKTIQGFGAATATPAMVTAGLKVAAQLTTLGLSGAGATTTTTTPAGGTSTTTTPSGAVLAANGSSSQTGDGSGSSGQDGSLLALTGSNPIPIVAVGAAMVVIAMLGRRRLLRDTASAMRRAPVPRRPTSPKAEER